MSINSKFIQDYNVWEKKKNEIENFKKLRSGWLFGKKITTFENYSFSKEDINKIMGNNPRVTGINVIPILNENNEVVIFIEQVMDGTSPGGGQGVGQSPGS